MPKDGTQGNSREAKIQRFIDEFTIDLVGSDAAKRAGFPAKTAAKTAGILMTGEGMLDYVTSDN